jgi:hypothetical protein
MTLGPSFTRKPESTSVEIQCAADALRGICRELSLFSVYSPHQSFPNVIGQAPTPVSRLVGGKRRQKPTASSESRSALSVG